MDAAQAKEQLQRVTNAYPSFREWLRLNARDPEATFCTWCEMLAGCDAGDVVAVVDKIIQGDSEPTDRYDKPDAMPRRIRERANALRSKRNERKRVDVLLSQACEDARSADPRLGYYWRSAIWLGNKVRDGSIDADQNDAAMVELSTWYRDGGERPSIFEELKRRVSESAA